LIEIDDFIVKTRRDPKGQNQTSYNKLLSDFFPDVLRL